MMRFRRKKDIPLSGSRVQVDTSIPKDVRWVEQDDGSMSSSQTLLQEWKCTFDAIEQPVIILDMDRAVLKANKAACELLAAGGEEEIAGRKCFQLFAGVAEPCRDCPLPAVKQDSKRHVMEVEHRFIGKTLRVTCAPVYNGKELIGYVHSALDISLQRNLEKQLVQAQKMEAIATLAGGIAHDFNNILGAILGNADLLQYRLPESDEEITGGPARLGVDDIKGHIGAIQKAGLRAKDLVSQILAFSRQTETRRKEVLITPVVKEAIKLLHSSLPSTIELREDISSDIGYILADPTQIHQVLMNLCTNAVAAIENQHGRIEISLKEIRVGPGSDISLPELKNGEYVALSVRDDGIGMSEDIMERIFDPFFTTQEVGEGTGMGLAVLHGIVAAHDGIVDVGSTPGQGSLFTIYFPRIEVREESEAMDPATNLPRGTETIIFADDEEEIVKMHTGMLEYLGYTVFPAHNGEQVLSCLERHLPEVDLVITDHTMPKMTGLELVEKIKELRSDLPVILCSGYNEIITDSTGRRRGVHKFLAKPLQMKDLANSIRQVLFETR